MAGAGSAERIVREWVVEWDEPEVERGHATAADRELGDAVRRQVADRKRSSVSDARRADCDAAATVDGWLPGEPLF